MHRNRRREYSQINSNELDRLLHSKLSDSTISMMMKAFVLADKYNLIDVHSDSQMASLFNLSLSSFKRARKQLIDSEFMRVIELRTHTKQSPRRALMIPVTLRWSSKNSEKNYWNKVWHERREPNSTKEYNRMDFGKEKLSNLPALDPTQEVVRQGNIIFYKESGEVAMMIPEGYSNIDKEIAKILNTHHHQRQPKESETDNPFTEYELQTKVDKAPQVNPYAINLINHSMDRSELLEKNNPNRLGM
jgi:hypothetical protein